METIYERNGYENRKDYLNSLAEEYGIDRQEVYAIASMLPSSEDFDGLITSLEDYSNEYFYWATWCRPLLSPLSYARVVPWWHGSFFMSNSISEK